MRKSLWVIPALLLIAAIGAPSAHADDTTVFSVSGTFTDDSTLTGTITIDVTTGVVTAEDLSYGGETYADIIGQGPFTGNTATGHTPVPVSYFVYDGLTASDFPRIDLGIPGTSGVDSLIGYDGGSLCSVDALCGPDEGGALWESAYWNADGNALGLESGELVATPEPDSFALMLIGLGSLGLLVVMRKRICRGLPQHT